MISFCERTENFLWKKLNSFISSLENQRDDKLTKITREVTIELLFFSH